MFAKNISVRWVAIFIVPLLIFIDTISLTGFSSIVYGISIFKDQMGIAVAPSGDVFVADTGNHRIQKFDPDGNFVRKWGEEGSALKQFNRPHGVATDSNQNVYVADTLNHRIQVFTTKGDPINMWGHLCIMPTDEGCIDPDGNGPLSNGDGQFYRPRGITLDKYDKVYVVDTFNDRIQMFTKDGKFLGKWGTHGQKDGQFFFPNDIAIDSTGIAYVTDSGNHRIQKFIPTYVVPGQLTVHGIFMDKWGQKGGSQGEFYYPGGIDVDLLNNVYVSDKGNNRVQKLSNLGSFITSWDGQGNGVIDHMNPAGIALNPSGTSVYVTDYQLDQVEKFTTSGGEITKWGEVKPVIIK